MRLSRVHKLLCVLRGTWSQHISALATQPGSKGRILLVEFAGATSQAPRVPCVAKHLDRTDIFLSKNGGLPPWPNPCPSPLPSKSSLNSTQIFPSRRKPEQIERGKLHPAKQNRIGAARQAEMGIPLRSLLVASLVLSLVALHIAAAKTIDPYKASNFCVLLLLRIPWLVANSRHLFN